MGAVLGYLLVMFANPVRASLRDGWRCIRRYGAVWAVLALFGLFYAVFQIGVDVFEHFNLPEGDRPIFQWARTWRLTADDRTQVLKDSILPALEGVVGVFNNLVTTFPFSGIAAVFFLGNWDGHHGVLFRALRRRFDGLGWLVYIGVLICAVAAIAMPLLYGPSLPLLNRVAPGLLLLQLSSLIAWLSFLFEYMFGVCVQIYLILMVYAWVRGLNFTHRHLLDFAIRRFSFVMKWSGIVMLLSTLFINLPQIFANVPPVSHWISEHAVLGYINSVVRPALVVFLFLFSTLQIVLTFHSESLSKALRAHFHFLRKEAWPVFWFLAISAIHFYFLNALNLAVNKGFGSGTAITIVWRLFYPLFSALVGGWMLATWVCLYKRSEEGRVDAENWIKF
jgi:hypothetical protein